MAATGILAHWLPVQPIRLPSAALLPMPGLSRIPRAPQPLLIKLLTRRATAITSTASGTAVADANLTLSKTLQTTGTIYDGEHVTFQIQVGNTGPMPHKASSFPMPASLIYPALPLVRLRLARFSGGNWNIGSLASGTTDTITVSGTITNAGTFSNTASATTTTYQATDPTGSCYYFDCE